MLNSVKRVKRIKFEEKDEEIIIGNYWMIIEWYDEGRK